MPQDTLISHRYFGWTPDTSYETVGLSLEEGQRLIGANTLAGFEPVVYTQTPAGEQLRTRDGQLLTVVALHSSAFRRGESVVRGVIEIEQV
ncbi:hypothetical protein [Streptomyces sp. NPDC006668]|uniref:hypothetical protein n=1 Tax=Streptomyces sp. NPDC006668 TaxID=3156903 RepID=UPI0033D0C4F4